MNIVKINKEKNVFEIKGIEYPATRHNYELCLTLKNEENIEKQKEIIDRLSYVVLDF